MKKLTFPVKNKSELKNLAAGDSVLVSGVIYTARDAAHKKLHGLIKENKPLPIELENQAIYYTGPCPKPENRPIGSCGPTTASRMDAYAPELLDSGLAAMIAKGDRNEDVKRSIKNNGAVYLAAAGGAGALMADSVKKCELVAFGELLSEAIYRLEVENVPLTVVIDADGNDLYILGRKKYEEKQ